MPDTFEMFLPFSVSTDADLTTPLSVEIDGHDGEIVMGHTHYELNLRRIANAEDAVQLLRKSATALLWTSVALGFGVQVDPTPNMVTLLEAPTPHWSMLPGIEGHTNYGACVYPNGMKISKAQVFPPARVFTTPPPDRVAELIKEGSRFPNAGRIWEHDRIPMAMHMFAESQFQASPYARFLASINVLEVLKVQEPRSTGANAVVDSWQQTLETAKHEKQLSPNEYQAMRSAIAFQRNSSIGQAIRVLVANYLGDDAANTARELYDIRSLLLHDGKGSTDDIRSASNRAVQLVRNLLRQMLERSLS